MCTEAEKKALKQLLFAADDLQSSAEDCFDSAEGDEIVQRDKIQALRRAIDAYNEAK